MAGVLGRAFVEVFADLSKFSPGLRGKIKRALDEQTKGMRFDELDKASQKAGESAADHVAVGMDSKIEKNMEKSGKKGGFSFSKGMSSVVGAMTSMLLPGLIAFGVSAAGALVPAIVALSATLPAAIGTAAGAMAVLMIATHGVGEALKSAFDPAKSKQFEAAMAKLAPAARSFVREIQALRPAFHRLQQDVQQTFFVQLQGALTRVTRTLLPTLRTGLHQLSADLGQMGKGLLTAFGNGKTDLAGIFIAAHEAIKPFIPLMGQLVGAFLTIGAVAGHLTVELSQGFAGLLGHFVAFVNATAESGAMENFFSDMLVVLRQFGHILGGVFDIFMSLITAMQATGPEALGVLGSIIEQLAAFFASADGQQTLIAVFTLVNTAMESIFKVITPLLPLVADLATALSGGLTDALTTLTPLLTSVADWLAANPDLVKAAVLAWGAYKVAMMAVATWEAIVDALNPATWIILAVAAIAAGAYLIYKNWDAVTSALKTAGGAIKDFFSGIWSWVTTVGRDIANWFTVTLPNFFKAIPGAIWSALSALPGLLSSLFMNALRMAGEAIGIGIGLIIVAIIKLPGLIWDGIKAIGHMFYDLWNLAFALGKAILTAGIAGVVYFFTVLPGKIGSFMARLPGIIGGAFRDAWNWAKREVREGADAVVDFVRRLPHRISGFMSNVGHDILGGLKAGINAVIGGFNSGINRVGAAVHIGLPNIPYLAAGGLITSPTLAVVGEAGKEAVIPMSDPAKAAQVAKQTGLLDMLGSRYGHAEAANVQVFLGTREITDILDVRINKKLDDQANELSYGTR